MAGEGHRRTVVANQGGGGEVHGRRADEAGDEQVDGRVVQRLRAVDLLQLAVTQHADPLAQGHGLDLVVGHVDGGDAEPLVQLRQRGAHRDAELGVQVGQRLVHQEGLRLADDGPAHGDALALAAGQRGRLALEVLLQAEHLGDLADPALDLVLGGLALLEAEGQVLLHGHVRVERVVLEDHRDVAVLGRQVVHDPAADADGPGGDLLQAGDGAQGGGLAAARRPDQDHELTVGDLQAEAVHALGAARIYLVHLIKNDLSHSRLPVQRGCRP